MKILFQGDSITDADRNRDDIHDLGCGYPKYAAKYLTDIGYDSYGVDVREGFVHSKDTIQKWQNVISPNITNGRSYYTEYKKILQKHVGHEANFWYFPTAFETPITQSIDGVGPATEGYCLGHLEFMVEDVLKEKHPGGIIIYTYYTWTFPGFVERMDVKDESGNYKYFGDQPKWNKYSQALRDVTAKFKTIKQPTLKLDV